jgi:hypothetical protein
MFDYVATKRDGSTVAVSVTRVLDNSLNAFNVDKADAFLKKKTENMLMAARAMSKVADQFVLHVWAPNHHVARECIKIAQQVESQLPDCMVMAERVVVEIVSHSITGMGHRVR